MCKQLGPKQGEALERAFAVCHEYGLTFQFYSRNAKVLDSIPEAIRQLGLALTDMVGYAVEVAVFYRKSARAMKTDTVTVDFNVSFGSRMASFASRKDRIAELMWSWQLQKSAEAAGKFGRPVNRESWELTLKQRCARVHRDAATVAAAAGSFPAAACPGPCAPRRPCRVHVRVVRPAPDRLLAQQG